MKAGHMDGEFEWSGNIADVEGGQLFRGRLRVSGGRIADVVRLGPPSDGPWLVPGLVDAHFHVESTMLPPSQFALALLPLGTVAAVCDPHEVANVMGAEGVRYMLADGARAPFHFCFGAPSCVPATPFESAGACFGPEEIGALLDDPRVGFLSEVMNFPAVAAGDPRMLGIIAEAALRIPARAGKVRVIEAVDGQILTGQSLETPRVEDGFALPVIPALKISDRGLFDVNSFRPVGLWE
ncbi:MAG: amidohydrolase family protein [Opitutales bacterium]|jgi:adenine deaminase